MKGVGPARAQALEQTGIVTINDLLYYFPRRHLNRTTVTPIKSIQRDTTATIIGNIQVCGERRTRRKRYYQAVISDGTGLLTLIWFNGVKYINRRLKIGTRLAVNGKIEFFNGFQIVHPEFDILSSKDDPLNTGAVIPLYPLNADLKKARIDHRGLRRLIKAVLDEVPEIEDLFSTEFLARQQLVPLDNALRKIHYAADEDELAGAVRRLKFDEHFFLQLLMALRKASLQQTGATAFKETGDRLQPVYDQLEFELTEAQKRVVREIRADLAKAVPMNRLLQGDVGSGKTVVAILAAAIAVGNGCQVAVMAPTEILAYQHFNSFSKLAAVAKISCALLVGNQKAVERKKILVGCQEGRLNMVVGTHALIQKDVEFKNLGLVVVDEQHRFGVLQRGELLAKGCNPHLLAMTATPIPRTLSITYHGDMDLSIIDELPKDRIPVRTTVIDPERLPKVYAYIRDEIARGRQCMIVYPLVEESEKSDLAAATAAFDELSRLEFPELVVGLLHGRMKKEEKDQVMQAFAANQIHILVSTTVIEVGIDVPNATVMLIEHAERFGLTQLHQLRGRVGRGSEKSHCILVRRKLTDQARQRLAIMARTSDGFEISDEDLKLRGPGEFFGARQSGFVKYKIADMLSDGPIIRKARQAAFDLVAGDPHLRKPQNKLLRERFIREYQSMLDIVNIS